MAVELVFEGDANQVVLNLLLTWIFPSPVRIRFERKGVKVAKDFDRGVQSANASCTPCNALSYRHSSTPGKYCHSTFRQLKHGLVHRRDKGEKARPGSNMNKSTAW